MKTKTPILLSMILFTSLPQAAHAGCCRVNFKQLGVAIGDVASFGLTAQQRDKERAEAREREAQMRAEQARREKENRINALSSERNVFSTFLGDFEYISQSLTDISFSMNQLQHVSEKELGNRSWLHNAFIPRVRELWTDEEQYSAVLLQSLEQLVAVANREGVRDESVSPDVDIAQKKEILARTRKVIVELRNVAKEQDMEVSQLLQVAMQRMETADAKVLVEKLTGAAQSVEALLTYVNERKTYNNQQIARIDSEIRALKSKP